MAGDAPRNVKALLVNMKDTSELMVDLAYSAVTYDNRVMAEEVLALEDHMNTLQQEAHKSLMLAARTQEDAEQLLGIVHIISAAEEIADAADDIATVVTGDTAIPPSLRAALFQSQEVTLRIALDDTDLTGETVETFEADAGGTQVIGLRRGDTWLFDPDDPEQLQENDVVFLRGPKDAVKTVYEQLTGDTFSPITGDAGTDQYTDLVTGLTDMKDMMELAIGLGYSAALFNNQEIAEEVLALESQMDQMREHVHTSILAASSTADDVDKLRGLSDIATASEIISDAALEIAAAVMRNGPPHPVLLEAIQESDEIITRTAVDPGSDLAGAALTDLDADTGLGMTVMALKRDGAWEYNPDPGIELAAGDVLIARMPASHQDRLQDLVAAS